MIFIILCTTETYLSCKLEKEEKAPNGLRVCKEENSGLAQINFKQLESFVKMALHVFSITFHHVKCIKVNFVFHKRKKLLIFVLTIVMKWPRKCKLLCLYLFSSVDPIRIAQFLIRAQKI
ncbi:hypothetical protein T03_13007 [Trichinella britovi]|uniref:Uncharacterized protein n=1 Tax=Trichinella britovi TaxID=45882 RepID=A0A0V1CGE1_TRIBR|nr:hypothetical protein T03_13007 [Trichinella britovi]